jgi:hypothetical protein
MLRPAVLVLTLAAFAAATVPMHRTGPSVDQPQVTLAYGGPVAFGDTLLVAYHDKRIGQNEIPVSIGITGWRCADPSPFTYLEYRVLPTWRLTVLVEVHEGTHREQLSRFPSCFAAITHLAANPSTRARHEAEAFCREIPAGVGVGYYANADSGVAHASRILSGAYPFGLSVDSAAALIRRECDLTRYGART